MSRLLNNSDEIRETLLARNLYSPENEYEINNPEITNAINFISTNIINPGNSFDFSNTVFGRIIGPQTPLTLIGRQALFNAKSLEVRRIMRTKTVPSIKLNRNFTGPKDLLSVNEVVDYTITRDASIKFKDKFFNTINEFTSFSSSVNPMDKVKKSFKSSYVWSNDLLLVYTGEGQKNELKNQISNNIYHNPNLFGRNIRNEKYTEDLLKLKVESFNNNLTRHFGNINDTVLNRIENDVYFTINYGLGGFEQGRTEYIRDGYTDRDIKDSFGEIYPEDRDNIIDNGNGNIEVNEKRDSNFKWDDNTNRNITHNRGILGYTKQIMKSLGNKASFDKSKPFFLDKNNKKHYNGTPFNQYSTESQYDYDKVRNPNGYTDEKFKDSSLFNTPVPKIVGNKDDNVIFSIENLATTFDSDKYPEDQKGRNNGRFMWFAPYIMNINETSSPRWNETMFLGRSEPVYTYAGSERALTLSIKLITDYDKNLFDIDNYNDFANYIHRKILPEKRIENKPKRKDQTLNKENKLNNDIEKETKNEYKFNYNTGKISYYFNDNSSDVVSPIIFPMTLTGSNSGVIQGLSNMLSTIVDYYEVNENARFRIYINGYSSFNGDSAASMNIANGRIESYKIFVREYARYLFPNYTNLFDIIEYVENTEFDDTPVQNVNYSSLNATNERKATIIDVEMISNEKYEKSKVNQNISQINKMTDDRNNMYDNTTENNDSNTQDEVLNRLTNNYKGLKSGLMGRIKNKVATPAFMMYNAKDLYDRITFLNQCTKQGTTLDSDGSISNSVFGKPPVLILRLGDVYHTKAIMTQITIDFTDQNTWDLNPEGFGVQYMGCDVILSFKLIGGSSIDGPTEAITNADSRRFYANSSFEDNKYKINNKWLDKEELTLDNLKK